MSRAFVREDDGWGTCRQTLESCIFAQPDGSCALSVCKYPERLPKQAPPPPPPAPNGSDAL